MTAVLLIGAAGLVGSHLRHAFSDRELVATCHLQWVDGAEQLDLTDHEAVRAIIRRTTPDVILLAAADAFVERCEREPAATRRVNVEPAQIIADEARRSGAALVVFSSEYVFDGRAGPYAEDDAPRPLNEYGRQKLEIETLVRSLDRHLICRTSGIFGREPARKNFVCQLVDRLRAGGTFDVPSDQVITPSHAPSLARAVRALVDREAWGTVHTAGPRPLPRLEFAEMVTRAFALPAARIRPVRSRDLGLVAERPKDAGLGDTKLRDLVGPLTGPEVALGEMAAEER